MFPEGAGEEIEGGGGEDVEGGEDEPDPDGGDLGDVGQEFEDEDVGEGDCLAESVITIGFSNIIAAAAITSVILSFYKYCTA